MSTERGGCLERALQCTLPAKGDTRGDGSYWRNLSANDVSARYGKAGEWGYRIKVQRWKSNSIPDGLSVNLDGCVDCRCSLILGARPDDIHAVRICLEDLAREIKLELIAQYEPLGEDEPTPNPCHYLILPAEASLEDMFEKIRHLADRDFPPSIKTPEEQQLARACQTRLGRVFTLVRDANAVSEGGADESHGIT